MKRKKRRYRNPRHIKESRDDMNNGTLREIWKNFFQPIIEDGHFDDENEFRQVFIDHIFGDRDIYTVRAKRKFDCPGASLDATGVDLRNTLGNTIDKDSRLWIRQDATQDFTDIEISDGRTFRVSNKQFTELERFITREQ